MCWKNKQAKDVIKGGVLLGGLIVIIFAAIALSQHREETGSGIYLACKPGSNGTDCRIASE